MAQQNTNGYGPRPITDADYISFGPKNAQVVIDIAIDVQCPDCHALWPHTMNFLVHELNPHSTRVCVLLYPLPYHKDAFAASAAVYAFVELERNIGIEDWHSWKAIYPKLISYFKDLSSGKGTLLPEADLKKELSALTWEASTYLAQFHPSLKSYSSAEYAREYDALYGRCRDRARRVWKYGASRGIFGTPMFIVNSSLQTQIDQDWTDHSWISFLDGFYSPSPTSKQ